MFGIFDREFYGPQDRDALNWALYLDQNIFKISGFCTDLPDPRIISKKNIQLIKLPKNKFLKNFVEFVCLLSLSYSYILIAKPNINVLFYLWLKKFLFYDKKKIIISLVNRLPYGRRFERILYSPRFIQFAISKQIMIDFQNLTGRQIPLVHLVYDLGLFYPSDKRSIEFKVVCIGSMQMRKNPFLFANIAKRFNDINFTWIGDGYYYDWILKKKATSSIDNLHLIKKMSQKDLAEFLRTFSVFLFPSVHEGFPNVIVEALASGLPVITFDTYGPEAVIDNFNGFIVGDEFEMVDKLKLLIKNVELLEKMSDNAANSSHKYSGEITIKELENLFLQSWKV